MENARIFNTFDQQIDLMQSLSLAVNFVPYDVNRIFDKQSKFTPDDILGGYAPHLPIEILDN